MAAVQALRDAKPDVVVLDLMMPRFTGVDVLKFIRSEPEPENPAGGGAVQLLHEPVGRGGRRPRRSKGAPEGSLLPVRSARHHQ